MVGLSRRPSLRARCVRKGFTLIELLVVIAIIAILAAILFPVFAKARERAKLTTCISNLKQLAIAFRTYSEDYDDKFVMSVYPLDWTQPDASKRVSNQDWGGRGGKNGTLVKPIDKYVANAKQVMRCPSDNGIKVSATSGNVRPSWETWDNSYVMNAFTALFDPSDAKSRDNVGLMMRNSGQSVPQPVISVRKYSEVREPARTILLGDHPMHQYWEQNQYWSSWHFAPNTANTACKVAVAFVDGHAEVINKTRGIDDPNGKWTFRPRGWRVYNP